MLKLRVSIQINLSGKQLMIYMFLEKKFIQSAYATYLEFWKNI